MGLRSTTISLFLALVSTMLNAQSVRVWGSTTAGGADNKGTLFAVDGDGTDYITAYSFTDASGWDVEGSLCLASNGKLYGTTVLGGEATGIPAGTIFSIDPGTNTFEKILDFDAFVNGGNGWAGMVVGNDGMLYGANYGGGSGGSIYRVDPTTDEFEIRFTLDGPAHGSAIEDRLLLMSDGTFYGLASSGGVNNAGTLFRFEPSSNTFTKLYDFEGGVNGNTPYGTPCAAGDGWLYFTTWGGGTDDKGTLARFNIGNSTYEKLLDFDGTNGQSPWNAPIRIAPDLLIGTTANGGSASGGLIYSYVPSTNTFTERFAFNSLNGGLLFGNVMLADDGLLYGQGSVGGSSFLGTVYRFDLANNTLVTLHECSPESGFSGRGNLVQSGSAVGVVELDGPATFSVYPNPSSGPMTVTLGDGVPAGAVLRITNALGQSVWQRSTQRSVEVSGLSAGVYQLALITGKGSSTRKIVIH